MVSALNRAEASARRQEERAFYRKGRRLSVDRQLLNSSQARQTTGADKGSGQLVSNGATSQFSWSGHALQPVPGTCFAQTPKDRLLAPVRRKGGCSFSDLHICGRRSA